MISYFVNYGISRQITGITNSAVWRVPFALQMLPGVLLLLVAFQNESPRWLIEKNRISEARLALAHVRGLPEDDRALREELKEIVADFEGKEQLSLGMQMKAACSSKQMFYQSSIGVILMFWQQWTGTNSINYYSPYVTMLTSTSVRAVAKANLWISLADKFLRALGCRVRRLVCLLRVSTALSKWSSPR